MNLVRAQQTTKRDYECTIQGGSLGFRIMKEREKTRAHLLIKSGSFESKIMINPRQMMCLRLLINDYLNHTGGQIDAEV